jgi:hypothetical protein
MDSSIGVIFRDESTRKAHAPWRAGNNSMKLGAVTQWQEEHFMGRVTKKQLTIPFSED